jgi:hypothetical protein
MALWIVARGKSYGNRSVAEQTMPEPNIYNQVDERLIAKTPSPSSVATTVIWNQVTKSEAKLVIKKS